MLKITTLNDKKIIIELVEKKEELIYMTNIEREQAINAAYELYNQTHNVEQAKENDLLMTSLDQIVKSLDLHIYDVDMHEVSKLNPDSTLTGSTAGFLQKNQEGKNAIYVNKNDTLQRKRFTIAHEIGHLMLNHYCDKPIHRDGISSEGTNTLEIQANAFAAELLMPKELVVYAFDVLGTIAGIAEIFEVSFLAAGNRLKNLGLI